MKEKIILASASPRRKELLTLCQYPFSVVPSTVEEAIIEETILKNRDSKSFLKKGHLLAKTLALAKAKQVLSLYPEHLIVGCDTLLVFKQKILGKPKDQADAKQMLKSLAGKTHHVITGVTLLTKDVQNTFTVDTKVRFQPLSADLEKFIEAYVASKQPLDKAGAYGIQDSGALLIDEIKGDYYSVMGLPISKIYPLLKQMLDLI